MSQFTISYRIAAQDDTQGTLRDAMANVGAFARKITKPITIPISIARSGLSLLRDIHLGLMPAVRSMDSLISRGAELDVTAKSFAALTGRSAADAGRLARSLVAASNGTLRIARAQQLANRAIAAGIKVVRDLPVILDFASKKAMSTGMGFELAMDRIIMGLSRGSPAILDDFGLMNDGLQGVKDTYDRINGEGAFEHLGPAAQKAEIVRQAMVDIQAQLGRMGVTGKEASFVWASIKNSVGDAMDRLTLAVGKSKSLTSALTSVRDVMSGIAKHLESPDSSFVDVLIGKRDTKSGGRKGGLLAIAKGAALDVGEGLGRGILYGVLKGSAKLLQIIGRIVDWADQKVRALWGTIKTEAPKLWESLPGKIADGFEAGVERVKAALADWMPSVFGGDGLLTPLLARSGSASKTQQKDEEAGTVGKVAEGAVASVLGIRKERTAVSSTEEKIQKALAAPSLALERKLCGPDIMMVVPDISQLGFGKLGAPPVRVFETPRGPDGQPIARAPLPTNPGLLAATLSAQAAIATADNGSSLWRVLGQGIATAFKDAIGTVFGGDYRNVFGRMAGDIDKLAETVSHGGVLRGWDETRTHKAITEFEQTFPPADETPQLGESYPLTQTSMFDRTRRIQQLNREIRGLAGSLRLRRQARSEALNQVEALRAKGRHVPNSEVHRRTQEILAKLIEQATQPLVAERDRLDAEIKESREISKRRLQEKREERKQRKEEREQRKIERERRQIDQGGRESGRPATADDRGPRPADKSLDDLGKTARADALMKTMDAMLAQLSQVVTALTGASSQLAQSA